MLKAKANPTFRSKVTVHVHGGESHEISVVWRHKRKDEFQKFFADAAVNDTPMVDQLLGLVESWAGLEFEVTADGLASLEQEFPSVIPQLLMAYAEELAEGRRKN